MICAGGFDGTTAVQYLQIDMTALGDSWGEWVVLGEEIPGAIAP